MDSRQQKILRSLSSISFGFVIYWLTFLATLLARLLLEGTLFGPMESDDFLPSSLTKSLLISIVIELIGAWYVGIKYYRHLEKEE